MKNSLLKTALLATLPLVAIQADNNVTQLNPFADDPAFKHFQKLHEEMNRVFEEFNHDFFSDIQIDPNFRNQFSNRLGMHPKTDFVDRGDNYELKVDLPGMDKNEIKVTLKDNLISIHAKNERKSEEKKENKIIHQERFFGVVSRTMSLPKDADPLNYTTDYKNGVLTVTIEKKK